MGHLVAESSVFIRRMVDSVLARLSVSTACYISGLLRI